MKPTRKPFIGFVIAVVLAAGLLLPSLWQGMAPHYDVMAAVPTPIAISRTVDRPQLATFFNSASITADTRVCVDSTYWDRMDLQYNIDQGTINTTTLTLQFSNDRVTYNSGINAVAANAADANSMVIVNLFAVQTCVLADVSNTNALTLTVKGLMK